MILEDRITVLVPISPIKSHPDISIVSHTVATIRFWFKTARIILMMDGVRAEQEEYRGRYEEAKARMKAHFEHDGNVAFMEFDKHTHQVGMTRTALASITTPLVLFVEQDMPITIDEPIEWEGIMGAVLSQNYYMVRLMHEAAPLAVHEHLMGKVQYVGGVRFRQTIQWSQRPHVASTEWYRRMLNNHFSPDANTFIEDRMHGAAQDRPWDYTRMAVYLPNDINAKRAYHTDGREGDTKFDMTF